MKIGFILQYLVLILITIIISIFVINFYLSLDIKKYIYIGLCIIAIINIFFTIICSITLLFDNYLNYGILMIYITGCLTMMLIYYILYLNKELQEYNDLYFFIIIAIIPIYTILWYNIVSTGSYYIKYKEFFIKYKNTLKFLKFHNFEYKNADEIAENLFNKFKFNILDDNFKDYLKEILKKLLFLNNN
jgi:hypothetical protein